MRLFRLPRLVVLAFVSVLCGGCALDDLGDVESRAAPIIGGTFDTDDPAVVAITETGGRVLCSGTLVSRHVVLTAGHCAESAQPVWAFFGSDQTLGGTFVAIARFEQHPNFDFDTLTNDIGIIVLEQPAPPAVTPVPFSYAPPMAGQEARFVGFGFTEIGPGGEYGRKYQTVAAITSVDVDTFSYGVATCNGDSGGPAFIVTDGIEVVAGVTSSGDTRCETNGVDTRVDVFASWLDDQIDPIDPATCRADGRCVNDCSSFDIDCPFVEDGCGCRVSSRRRSPTAAFLLLCAVLFARGRRRATTEDQKAGRK